MTRSDVSTTAQNSVEAPSTTAQTPSINRSVVVGDRRVNSTSSTPNGRSQVTNVVATPYPTKAEANRGVDMSASRAIDQRNPVAIGPPSGIPLLAADPTSWIVNACRKVVPSRSRRMMSALVTRSNTPSPTRARTTRADIERISASAEPMVARCSHTATTSAAPTSTTSRSRAHSATERPRTVPTVDPDVRGRSIVPAGSF